MAKKVVLVGHCGPDSSFLRMAVSSADRGITVSMADDTQELKSALDGGVDLVLLNRELGWGFDHPLGVDVLHPRPGIPPDHGAATPPGTRSPPARRGRWRTRAG